MLYREIIAVCSEIHTKQINTAVWAERVIFRRVRKIANSDYYLCHVSPNFYQCVCPSVSNNSAPTGWIYITFGIGGFLENLSNKFKFR